MRRFLLLVRNEFRLVRSDLLIHALVVFQPVVFFLLMSTVMVEPTFDMYVERSESSQTAALITAMQEVGSPIGAPYIRPILVEPEEEAGLRQVVRVEQSADGPTAVQHFGLVDSNIVKNYRNRLTAAGLHMWDADLDGAAVTIEEYPWLPRDMPFILYYGLALLPMAAFLAGALIGGMQMARDFEEGMILEYRLAPASATAIVAARLVRIAIWSLLAVTLLLLTIGLSTGIWPDSVWQAGLILLPVGLIAGCLGMLVGLSIQRLLPTFVLALTASLGFWLLGGAFGLPAGFGGLYELISHISPVTYAVKLLFGQYYGVSAGSAAISWLVLLMITAFMLVLVLRVYNRRVVREMD